VTLGVIAASPYRQQRHLNHLLLLKAAHGSAKPTGSGGGPQGPKRPHGGMGRSHPRAATADRDQAALDVASMALASPVLISILRVLACSATGIVTDRTPLS